MRIYPLAFLLLAGAAGASPAEPPGAAPLPAGVRLRLGRTNWRDPGYLQGITFAPDGKTLATGSMARNVRLWDAATGEQIRCLDHPAATLRPAYSPDGKWLACPCQDGNVHIWEVATGKPVRHLGGGAARFDRWGQAAVFTPNGKHLAVAAGGHGLMLWRVADGGLVRSFGDPAFNSSSVCLSPDAEWVAAGNIGGEVAVYETSSGKLLRGWNSGVNALDSLAFSPDGKLLATGHQAQVIRLWDASSGRLVREVDTPRQELQRASSVVFAPNGKWLAEGGWLDCGVRLFDPGTGKEIRRLDHRGRLGTVSFLAVSPDGKTLAGTESGLLRVWDVATGKERTGGGDSHRDLVTSLAFAADGNTLLSGAYDGTVRLWEVRTGKQRQEWPSPVQGHRCGAKAVFGTGQRVIVAYMPDDGGQSKSFTRLLDRATGKVLHELPAKREMVTVLSSSPDGRTLAVGGPAGTVELRRTDTGALLRRLPGHLDFFPESAWAPDGRSLAVADRDRVWLWDAPSGKPLAPLRHDRGQFSSPTFSPDGRTLAALTEKDELHLWSVSSRLRQGMFPLAERKRNTALSNVAFSPDSRLLAVSSDGTIRFFERWTGRERFRIANPGPDMWSLTFAPDGKGLATGHADGTISLLNLEAFRPLPERRRLSEKELERCWADLRHADAAKADAALRALLADPGKAEALAREKLRPAAGVDARQVARWIADLDAAEFEVRERATAELARLGVGVEAALVRALADRPSLEARLRIERLLRRGEGSAPDLDRVREFRTVELLERAGTPGARAILRRLAAGGPFAPLTVEARFALARLDR